MNELFHNVECRHVGIEYDENHSAHAVAVTGFDFSSMDTLADEIREAVLLGHPLEPIVERAVEAASDMRCGEAIRIVLSEILSSRRPETTAWALAYASGMSCALGLSDAEIARRLGTSKQSFSHGVQKLRARFGNVLKNATQRSDAARDRMRAAYHHGS